MKNTDLYILLLGEGVGYWATQQNPLGYMPLRHWENFSGFLFIYLFIYLFILVRDLIMVSYNSVRESK